MKKIDLCLYINIYLYIFIYTYISLVAQSEQRITTGWTVIRSNPGGGDIFRPAPGLTQPSTQWVSGLLRG